MKKFFKHYQTFGRLHQNFIIPIEEVNSNDQGFLNLPKCFDVKLCLSDRDEICQKVSYLKLNEQSQFFFNCWAGNFKMSAFFWMYYYGSPNEAKNFSFKLRLFNEGSEKEIHVTGPAIPIDINYRKMQYHPLSFKLPFSEIKQFWNQNVLKLSWDVTVLENNFPNSFSEIVVLKIETN